MDIEMVGDKVNYSQINKEGKSNSPRSTEEHTESLIGKIMMQVGSMLNARFEALEGRLLPEASFRPKLAGQTQKQAESVKVPTKTTYASVLSRGGPNNKQPRITALIEKEGKTNNPPKKKTSGLGSDKSITGTEAARKDRNEE